MIADITTARDQALSRVAAATSVDDVARLDAELLGKKGALATLKAGLGKLATIDEKKAAVQQQQQQADVRSSANGVAAS